MRCARFGFAFALVALLGCGVGRPLWHDERLPSGRTIKVTSFMLVWGVEHEERNPGDDCFALEYVRSEPKAALATREQEALEAFELIRPASERWGFPSATLAGFPALERKGPYDLFVFRRATDGTWSFERTDRKVFAND